MSTARPQQHIGTVRRLAQPVAAVAALLVLFWALSVPPSFPLMAPLWALAGLLGLGLAAEPLTQLAGGRATRTPAQAAQRFALAVAAVAAVASLLALFWQLSVPHYLPSSTPAWALAGSLGLGLAAGPLAQLLSGLVPCASVEAVDRFAQPITAVAALLALFWELLIPHEYFSPVSPIGPLWVIAGLLAFGLAAGPLAGLAARGAEQVLSERVAELSRTRAGALRVQTSELRRIERDLHDGAQARLVALSLKLGRAEERPHHDARTAALLREAREDAAAAIRELRELARRPPAEVETAAYFVVAECLTNAAKHAPGAPVEVRLDDRGGDLIVEVGDLGPGGADPAGGGLTGLRRRAEALDGRLQVTSPAAAGTRVVAVLPIRR